MFSKILHGSKISFFLMWIFTLPIFLEMEYILKIWLINPPVYAVLFTRLALIEVLINSISLPITAAARAPGRMKTYELSLGSIQIAIFLFSWLILKLGAEAYSVFIIAIIANFIMFFVRLHIVSRLINLPVNLFMKTVVFPVTCVILFSTLPSLGVHLILHDGTIYFGLSILTSLILSTVAMYFFGLDAVWRKKSIAFAVNSYKKLMK
jgi:hypothetical protein